MSAPVVPDRPRPPLLVEACVASITDASAAAAGGAHRLEVNRQLHRDGLTPPPHLVRGVLQVTGLPVIAMVRPHDRGFVYTPSEIDEMVDDARELVELGAAGVAVGPLTREGAVHRKQLRMLRDAARGADVVFHRAFDVASSMEETLETLIDAGVTRVLTSGQAPTAEQGIDALRRLRRQADGRIEILPGAGIRPDNAAEIVAGTGCDQLHGTFRDPGAPAGGTSADVVAAVLAAASAAHIRGS